RYQDRQSRDPAGHGAPSNCRLGVGIVSRDSDIGRCSVVGSQYRCFRNKAITALRYGLDKLRFLRAVSEDLAEFSDAEGEVAFFDKGVGPKPLHQLVFTHYVAVLFNEDVKQFEYLRRDRDPFIAAQQDLFLDVENKAIERKPLCLP